MRDNWEGFRTGFVARLAVTMSIRASWVDRCRGVHPLSTIHRVFGAFHPLARRVAVYPIPIISAQRYAPRSNHDLSTRFVRSGNGRCGDVRDAFWMRNAPIDPGRVVSESWRDPIRASSRRRRARRHCTGDTSGRSSGSQPAQIMQTGFYPPRLDVHLTIRTRD